MKGAKISPGRTLWVMVDFFRNLLIIAGADLMNTEVLALYVIIFLHVPFIYLLFYTNSTCNNAIMKCWS